MSFYIICAVVLIYVVIWIIRKLRQVLRKIKQIELNIQYYIHGRQEESKGEEAEEE